jgi:hypothetical protein
MRKLNCMLLFMLTAILLLMAVNIISAQQSENQRQPGQRQGRQGNQNQQQRNQGQRQEGQQVDPAQTLNQMMERALGQLNLSETEAAVIKPKMQLVLQSRIDQSTEMRELTRTLRDVIDAKNSELIKSKLAVLKAKRKEQKAKAEALEAELIELLSVEQEAQLTILGVVNSDSAEFRGGRGQGQRNQTNRQNQQ